MSNENNVECSEGQTCRSMTIEELVDHSTRYFKFSHLPAHLQAVSKPFSDLARTISERQHREGTDWAQTELALTLLLQAKDAAVRALIK